jgi:hypothetical protein
MCSLRGGWQAHWTGSRRPPRFFGLSLPGPFLVVLSPARAVPAAGAEGAVWQEGKPGGVDRADDVAVGGHRPVGDLAV